MKKIIQVGVCTICPYPYIDKHRTLFEIVNTKVHLL